MTRTLRSTFDSATGRRIGARQPNKAFNAIPGRDRFLPPHDNPVKPFWLHTRGRSGTRRPASTFPTNSTFCQLINIMTSQWTSRKLTTCSPADDSDSMRIPLAADSSISLVMNSASEEKTHRPRLSNTQDAIHQKLVQYCSTVPDDLGVSLAGRGAPGFAGRSVLRTASHPAHP